MMLPKSAAVFALDVNCPGDSLSKAVEICMHSAEEKMIFAPHDELGLVLAGTAESQNPLHESCARARYQHISVPCGIAPPVAGFLELLRRVEPAREPHDADFLETLIVCAHLLREHTAKRRYRRVVYLITDARVEAAHKEDIAPLLESLQRDAISLIVVGVDFAQADSETADESSWAGLSVKAQNERVLHFLCGSLGEGSLVVPLSEAVAGLSRLRRRNIAQRPLLRVVLSIGDVRIATQMFTKTQEERLPVLKRVTESGEEIVTRTTYVGLDDDDADGADGPAARGAMDEKIDEKNVNLDAKEAHANPSGCELKRRVLVRAYRYGRSLIPCTDADVEAMRVRGPRALDAVAFVPLAELPVYVLMGGVRALLPLDDDVAGTRAFRSIVRAMAEAEKAMIVRFVRSRDAKPVLGACVPSVKERRDTLFFAPLPFAEDVRLFRFSDLAEIQFTDEETQLMDNVVRDLTVDEDVLRPRETFNPVIQQYYATLRAKLRASASASASGIGIGIGIGSEIPGHECPNGGCAAGDRSDCEGGAPALPLLPELRSASTAFGSRGNRLEPVMARAQRSLEACAAAFPLAPAPAPAPAPAQGSGAAARPFWFRGEAGGRASMESPAPSTVPAGAARGRSASSAGTAGTVAAGGFDAEALRVTTVDPAGTFRAMVESADAVLAQRAADELVEAVFKLLRYSIADAQYEKCAECVAVLRVHCVAADEPAFFNSFLVKLMLMARELDHMEFWKTGVISRGVGPITRRECGSSTLDDENAAQKFLSLDRSFPQPVFDDDEEDDLLDMIC